MTYLLICNLSAIRYWHRLTIFNRYWLAIRTSTISTLTSSVTILALRNIFGCTLIFIFSWTPFLWLKSGMVRIKANMYWHYWHEIIAELPNYLIHCFALFFVINCTFFVFNRFTRSFKGSFAFLFQDFFTLFFYYFWTLLFISGLTILFSYGSTLLFYNFWTLLFINSWTLLVIYCVTLLFINCGTFLIWNISALLLVSCTTLLLVRGLTILKSSFKDSLEVVLEIVYIQFIESYLYVFGCTLLLISCSTLLRVLCLILSVTDLFIYSGTLSLINCRTNLKRMEK